MPIPVKDYRCRTALVPVSPGQRLWRGQSAQVRQILKSPALQTKLKLGVPDDKYEQEADRVADRVIRMPDTTAAQSAALDIRRTPQITPLSSAKTQRLCNECEDELQTKPQSEAGGLTGIGIINNL